MSHTSRLAAVALTTLVVALAGALASHPDRGSAARFQTTLLISRSMSGGVPNAASTNPVISGDKRFARAIAFQSNASDLVPGDANGATDVFVVFRAGPAGNNGSPWKPGRTVLVSHPRGAAANGASFLPAVDGSFHHAPSCVAFLSAATNLAPGDTNGKVDAFVSHLPGGAPKRVSLPGGQQAGEDTTDVAVSGDCKLIAFVTGGRLYVLKGGRVHAIQAPGVASGPSFSTGLRNDLVFAAGDGVYLSRGGTGKPRLVAPGGRNPAYNDIKRQVVAYELTRDGRTQIGYRDLGKREQIISARGGVPGNGDSFNPIIGNAGYYVSFQTEATNLGTDALRRQSDANGKPDVYLYTNVRRMTLVESVQEKAVPLPGGGQNPSMSFYANYLVFDSPAPIGGDQGPHQVFMRYLGGI